jgi:hypothetical protein
VPPAQQRTYDAEMRRFNPLSRVGPPALLGVILGVAAVSGGHRLWPLGIVPGVIFCVLGVRIGYDPGLARGADQIREATPWNAWTPAWYYRQANGAVVAIFGLFFIGLGAIGIAKLAS